MVLQRPIESTPLSGKFETDRGALVVEVAANPVNEMVRRLILH